MEFKNVKYQPTNERGTMQGKGIFVFGTKIFDEVTKRDAISTLPLELSWKIFSYLDDASLQFAYRFHKPWSRIISANKKLRSRLNKFELAAKLGSEGLARFYRRNQRKIKRERIKNIFNKAQRPDHLMRKERLESKREENYMITVNRKRLRLL